MSASDTATIGSLLDTMGVLAPLGEGDLVADALVILEVLQADGASRLEIAWSAGLAWPKRAGLLRIAERMASDPCDHDI